MKWQAPMFRRGTQVLLDLSDCFSNKAFESEVLTVDHVVRNGPRSWVLVTTTMRPSLTNSDKEESYSINISYVKEIVKPGSGPLVIDNGWYGMTRIKPLPADRMRLSRDWMLKHGATVPSGNIVTADLDSETTRIGLRLYREDQMVDWETMRKELIAQTWVKRIVVQRFHLFSLDTKKLESWMRRNRNRFLMNFNVYLLQQAKDHEEMMAADDNLWGSLL